jgi:hypothetical protein
MKKLMIAIAACCLAGCTFAQKDQVSALFDKYNGKEGITVVNVTGDMLKLISQAEEQRRDTVFTSKLNEIKVLAVEKSCDKPVNIDFKQELYDKLDKSLYKEMVSVKKEGQDVVVLFRENGERISEILIIVGGNEDNALVQVKGDMLMSEMADMFGKYQINGMEQLKMLENK